MPAPGEHHPAFEEYCECIFELHEDDVEVIQARIAERLNVSRPAVSEMIRRLADEGLIDTEGGIALTAAGDRVPVRAGGGRAEETVESLLDAVRHDVLPLAGLVVGLGP